MLCCGFRFDSYKLDAVAKALLNEGKLDVNYMEMWRAWSEGDGETLARVGEYCIVDAELVLRIATEAQVWVRLLEQSRVTYVPMAMLASRGEQIKTFSQILRYAHEKGYLVVDETFQKANSLLEGGTGKAARIEDQDQDGPLINDEDTYAGGYVMDPIVGAYYEWPVHVFDFQASRKVLSKHN